MTCWYCKYTNPAINNPTTTATNFSTSFTIKYGRQEQIGMAAVGRREEELEFKFTMNGG
jgi:hypothetical protein